MVASLPPCRTTLSAVASRGPGRSPRAENPELLSPRPLFLGLLIGYLPLWEAMPFSSPNFTKLFFLFHFFFPDCKTKTHFCHVLLTCLVQFKFSLMVQEHFISDIKLYKRCSFSFK